MKLYKVDFDPMYPVPSGLIILAENKDVAQIIATETIKHTKPKFIQEVPMTEGVVFYESGDY